MSSLTSLARNPSGTVVFFIAPCIYAVSTLFDGQCSFPFFKTQPNSDDLGLSHLLFVTPTHTLLCVCGGNPYKPCYLLAVSGLFDFTKAEVLSGLTADCTSSSSVFALKVLIVAHSCTSFLLYKNHLYF